MTSASQILCEPPLRSQGIPSRDTTERNPLTCFYPANFNKQSPELPAPLNTIELHPLAPPTTEPNNPRYKLAPTPASSKPKFFPLARQITSKHSKKGSAEVTDEKPLEGKDRRARESVGERERGTARGHFRPRRTRGAYWISLAALLEADEHVSHPHHWPPGRHTTGRAAIGRACTPPRYARLVVLVFVLVLLVVVVVVRERRDAFQEANWLWAASKGARLAGRKREKARTTHTRTRIGGGNRLAAQVMTSKGSLTSGRQISITATPLPRYGNNPFPSKFLGGRGWISIRRSEVFSNFEIERWKGFCCFRPVLGWINVVRMWIWRYWWNIAPSPLAFIYFKCIPH